MSQFTKRIVLALGQVLLVGAITALFTVIANAQETANTATEGGVMLKDCTPMDGAKDCNAGKDAAGELSADAAGKEKRYTDVRNAANPDGNTTTPSSAGQTR